jgi:FtsZ-binding cell division protein ZapB
MDDKGKLEETMKQSEMKEAGALSATVERLAAAAAMLEKAAEQLTAGQSGFREEMQNTVARIVATTERSEEFSELEAKLQAAVAEIAALRAEQEERSTDRSAGRKTLPVTTANLLAKHGLAAGAEMDASALDAALTSLSIEQRIAVKSQLLRAGLVG